MYFSRIGEQVRTTTSSAVTSELPYFPLHLALTVTYTRGNNHHRQHSWHFHPHSFFGRFSCNQHTRYPSILNITSPPSINIDKAASLGLSQNARCLLHHRARSYHCHSRCSNRLVSLLSHWLCSLWICSYLNLLCTWTLTSEEFSNTTASEFVCPLGKAAFCAGTSLETNIIIRCNGTFGQPGNCDDK